MATKGVGSFLKKAARGRVVSERNLATKETITPEEVLGLQAPTTQFLCEPSANIYGIEFVAFKLRDMESGNVLVNLGPGIPDSEAMAVVGADNSGRFVRYQFRPDFFDLKSVGASVTFCVGDKPVPNFRMIERHFFGNKLIKSFDFDFGFCIPESTNTCEHIYELPKLPKADIDAMIATPYATKSDSFYFVDGKLVMHNKAEYAYDGTF
ncbi:hypothetical protein PTSG_03033 [Salpingoeca rosetta]|uniref:GMP phosphodiesterase delta subunit domain-containing protein n=1 Tax=Salpingoeca rosetta (strain ATCC 50818 / BSB-021) TaxID=946362 RepID=F2U422_SALR5|nr:uncharacterized protein PTSG_03033 [Salpingoeca rosetta]EGD82366.1 hypothetical protein PTSG_03033 [Salpingoeca rosetta]|eukprot:XP_004996549.1 hypothetical protein PTSG_03033 [Salpingoeca rosetta]